MWFNDAYINLVSHSVCYIQYATSSSTLRKCYLISNKNFIFNTTLRKCDVILPNYVKFSVTIKDMWFSVASIMLYLEQH